MRAAAASAVPPTASTNAPATSAPVLLMIPPFAPSERRPCREDDPPVLLIRPPVEVEPVAEAQGTQRREESDFEARVVAQVGRVERHPEPVGVSRVEEDRSPEVREEWNGNDQLRA